jgi:DNA-binding CsgD family transcriptional regulator
MTELEEFSSLIGSIYDAALDDARWAEVASRIARHVGTHSGSVQVRKGSVPRVLGVTDNFTQGMVDDYAQHYGTVDLWAREILRTPDVVHLGTQIVPERIHARSEQSEFFGQADIYFAIGTAISISEDETCVIGIHHARCLGDFEERTLGRLALVAPHMRRAFRLRGMFQEQAIQRGMALQALHGIASPVLLADRRGTVRFANEAAADLMRSSGALTVRNGRLQAACAAATNMLHRFIEDACDMDLDRHPAEPRSLLVAASDGSRVSLVVTRVPAGDMDTPGEEPMAMIMACAELQPRTMSMENLRALFDLTPKEAGIAISLADGKSLVDIADERGVSRNTLWTQLKSAMQKTGTRRQAELVSRILRLTVPRRQASTMKRSPK